ncbi:hypothetical protein CHM34_15300 [Paludifilum halophilum]|uniref:Transposase InsH N-terminal domain-containing protein n=1 Tax=Paludifilum halophilum TaxID=1642702 RepID=A0A235B3Y2_9BACL|nr:hypothetical protein CHM34_15300 [Paludifilum halophilum]
MFQTNPNRQGNIEFVYIEELVPEDHLLRKIDETIDFSFIAEKTRPLYSPDNGRPCLDPVMLFKMLFIGYLYGIRSERRLVEEIQVNVAYRWFVGLSLTDPVPHSSTFSQNRRRRFVGTLIYQWQYKYDEQKDVYTCPANHELTYRTTNRQGYREYKSNPSVC